MRSLICLVGFLLISIPFFTRGQNFWEQTSGPTGGDVRALAVNVTGDIYAGTWGAGIFRSTDNGENWVQVNQNLSDWYVNVFATNSLGEVFVGTYDGVAFSNNHGNSWTHLGLFGIPIFSLTINSNNDIFAGTNAFVNNGIGLYRSTDSGQSWAPLTNGLPNSITVLCFAIHPGQPGEIYLGSSDGIYRSSDNGNSWMQVGLDSYSVNAIVFHPNGDIFAGARRGIYRSSDNGNTWVKVLNETVESISINSAGYLFAGTGGGIFRSLDNGNSWVPVNNGLYNKVIWTTTINYQDHIFAGTFDGGVFRSLDNGDNWIQTNTGIINTDIYALAIKPDNTIWAGTWGNGLFSSTDNGENWVRAVFQGLRVTAIAFNSFNHIFVGTSGEGMFRSTDGGSNWVQINSGLPPGVVDNRIYAILIKQVNNYIFLATASGGYRSTDNGDSWAYMGPPPFGRAAALAMDSQENIYIGFDHGGFVTPPWGVHVSNDDGNNWTLLGLIFEQIMSLAINSQDHIFAATTFGVHRSTDQGNTWASINNGLNHIWITDIAINSEDHLFVGTWGGGVYRSENNGGSWSQVNSGLPYSTVFSLAINSEGYIFAGTLSGGVFRSVNPIISIDQRGDPIPVEFLLEQNYPNPFNSQTTIEFYSPQKEIIVVEVFNILGVMVETLLEGEVLPGKHRVTFDASNLPSGVYVYCLKTPGSSLSKKMVLLR